MTVAEEFESILKELPTLKAPGVSGSRIKKLTDLAVQNVSDEVELIQILYSSCKSTPSTHKLGILYVVDSIVRVFIEESKKKEEPITPDAPEGTFADGVNKISELIVSIIDNSLELMINQSQIEKIGKLVDIWERANTFNEEIIGKIRAKHFKSTTPPGSPPPSHSNKMPESGSSNSKDSGSILSALASLAKSNSQENTPKQQSATTVNNANNILSQLSALNGNSSNNQPPSQQQGQQQGQGSEQYIMSMLQSMQGNGNSNGSNYNKDHGNVPSSLPAPPRPLQQHQNDYGRRGREDEYSSTGYSRRNRSRSPNRNNGGFRDQQPRYNQGPPIPQTNQGGYLGAPNGGGNVNTNGYSNFPQGGNYSNQYTAQYPADNNAAQVPNGNGFQQGGFQQGFQSQINHSPGQAPGGGFTPYQGEMNIQGTPHYRPRNIGFDSSLPQGSFKVLSRTLFIGGVPRNMTEREMANLLRPFAEVQSVILNSERKHAFVKVYSRREAEQVITSFNKDNALPLRTRWGVGFGPRDCCNYQHGVSIIPIQRLTDADRAWVVQAQWGGTGGRPLEGGLVIDEPDIEIGTGISSKAMSKKMPTNSARNGPKSNRPGESDEDYVKTTLLQQSAAQHGGVPGMNQQGPNPLAGLFNQNNGFQNGPPPPQQGFNGGNLGNQMASFFQRQQ